MSFNVKNSFVLKSLEPRYGPCICIMYTVQVLFDATLSKCVLLFVVKRIRGTDFVTPVYEWYHYCILPVEIYDLALIAA